MKRKNRNSKILAAALCLGLANGVYADPLADGYAAFQRQDYGTALRHWVPLAEIGDSQAQFYLSEIYGNGLGVPADPGKALEWLLAAARQGFPPAQFNLGNNYHGGRWVAQDYNLATSWWRGAAEQGFVQAQYNLAVSYFQGLGVERDVPQALYWFQKAARGGSQPAQETLQQLGMTVEGGQAVPVAQAPVATPPPRQQYVPPQPTAYRQPAQATYVDRSSPRQPAQATYVDRSVERSVPASRPAPVAQPSGEVGGTYRGGQNEAWILGEPPENYTLQVFSDTSHNSALHTAGRMASLGFPVGVFSFVRDNKYWYATIIGSFESAKEASSARRGLPPEVMESNPWVRTMRSVQKIMVTE